MFQFFENFGHRTAGGQVGGGGGFGFKVPNYVVNSAPRSLPQNTGPKKTAAVNQAAQNTSINPYVVPPAYIVESGGDGGGGGGGGYDNSQQDPTVIDNTPMDYSNQPIDDSGINNYPNTPDDNQDTDNFNDVPTALDTNNNLETKSVYTNDIYHVSSKPVDAPAYDYLKGETFPIKGVLKIYNSAFSVGDKHELHNTFFGGGDFLIEDVKFYKGNVICQVIVKNTYTGWCFFNETGIKLSHASLEDFENLSTDNEAKASASLPDPDTIVDTLQSDKVVFDSINGNSIGSLNAKSYLGDYIEKSKDPNSDSYWYHYSYKKYPNIGLQMGLGFPNPKTGDVDYWFLAEPDEIGQEPIKSVGMGAAKTFAEMAGATQDAIDSALNTSVDFGENILEDIFILILLLVAAYIAYKIFVK